MSPGQFATWWTPLTGSAAASSTAALRDLCSASWICWKTASTRWPCRWPPITRRCNITSTRPLRTCVRRLNRWRSKTLNWISPRSAPRKRRASSQSSSPTCRTSCVRRSTAWLALPAWRWKPSSIRPSATTSIPSSGPPTTCWRSSTMCSTSPSWKRANCCWRAFRSRYAVRWMKSSRCWRIRRTIKGLSWRWTLKMTCRTTSSATRCVCSRSLPIWSATPSSSPKTATLTCW